MSETHSYPAIAWLTPGFIAHIFLVTYCTVAICMIDNKFKQKIVILPDGCKVSTSENSDFSYSKGISDKLGNSCI